MTTGHPNGKVEGGAKIKTYSLALRIKPRSMVESWAVVKVYVDDCTFNSLIKKFNHLKSSMLTCQSLLSSRFI